MHIFTGEVIGMIIDVIYVNDLMCNEVERCIQ